MRTLTNAERVELRALCAKLTKLETQSIILNQAAAFFAQDSKLCSLPSMRRRPDSQCESAERPSTSGRVAIMPGPNSSRPARIEAFSAFVSARPFAKRFAGVKADTRPNRACGAKTPRASHLASERRGPHATRLPRVSSTQGIQNARARASPPLASLRHVYRRKLDPSAMTRKRLAASAFPLRPWFSSEDQWFLPVPGRSRGQFDRAQRKPRSKRHDGSRRERIAARTYDGLQLSKLEPRRTRAPTASLAKSRPAKSLRSP